MVAQLAAKTPYLAGATWPASQALVIALAIFFSRASISEQGKIEPGPLEIWSGVLDSEQREFRFLVTTSRGADGSSLHELLSLDEGPQRFKLDRFVRTGQSVEFDLNVSRAKYAGTLSPDGRTITGKWRQSGQELELVFHRVERAQPEPPDEVWGGTLDAVIQKLELRFRIYRDPGGATRVRMDSVTQKAGGFKGEWSVDGDQWVIKVPAVQGQFAGRMNADKSEVAGKWKQGIASLDLKLTRVDPRKEPEPKKRDRPQTPRPPFPYDVEQAKFENAADHVTLAGTLTIPASGGRSPAAVLISGSGPQDRDETILEHKPFWVWADHLARHGIAVLRYDDRGTGESTGRFATGNTSDFARDAEAAVDFLKRHPRIDPGAIGLIGHSEGAIVAPILAARRSDVAWIVMLAGTGVNGEEILVSQGELIWRAEGAGAEEQLRLTRKLQKTLIGMVKAAPPDADEGRLVDEARRLVRKEVTAEEYEKLELDERVKFAVELLSSPWFRFFLSFEPGAAIRQVKCPVLAVNGDKDVQVDADLNLPAIERALREGGNRDFEILRLPGLNHLLQPSSKGAVSEYQEIEQTIAPAALDAVTRWIQQRTK
jgi:pimeloyl-ACP methyl ester carboxylesterase